MGGVERVCGLAMGWLWGGWVGSSRKEVAVCSTDCFEAQGMGLGLWEWRARDTAVLP